MAVPDADCVWEKCRFSWQSKTLVGGAGGNLISVTDDGCGRETLGSHGSSRRWLWSGGAGILMAVTDAG